MSTGPLKSSVVSRSEVEARPVEDGDVACFVAHPQHPAMVRAKSRRHVMVMARLALASVGCFCLIVYPIDGILPGVLWPLVVLLVSALILKGRDYVRLRRLERRIARVWADDPDWALAQLGESHASYLANKQESRSRRRMHAVNVCLAMIGLIITLGALTMFSVHRFTPFWFEVLQMVLFVLCIVFGITIVYQGSKHSRLDGRIRRYESDRKLLKQSIGELPDGEGSAGALSVSMGEDSLQGAISAPAEVNT